MKQLKLRKTSGQTAISKENSLIVEVNLEECRKVLEQYSQFMTFKKQFFIEAVPYME